MSEVIALIHNETDTRRIQKTLEDTTLRQRGGGCELGLVGPTCRSAGRTCRSDGPLVPTLSHSFKCRFSTALGFASTPSFQVSLIQGLRIDALPYIYQPLPPSLRHKSFSQEGKNPNHSQSSTIFQGIANQARSRGRQASLGLLIVSRAWLGIAFVPPPL